MSGGQIAALVFAIILLLPGGCFLLFGIGFATDSSDIPDVAIFFVIAAILLVPAGFLFWVAFRRRRQPPGTGPNM